jgi:hypothetical protein
MLRRVPTLAHIVSVPVTPIEIHPRSTERHYVPLEVDGSRSRA